MTFGVCNLKFLTRLTANHYVSTIVDLKGTRDFKMFVQQITKLLCNRNFPKNTIKLNSSYTCTKENLRIHKETKVICQGFTGKEGTLHCKLCMEYGTKIVGGVNPKKGGQKHLGLPVFASVKEAKGSVNPDASIVFVPAPNAAKVITILLYVVVESHNCRWLLFLCHQRGPCKVLTENSFSRIHIVYEYRVKILRIQ